MKRALLLVAALALPPRAAAITELIQLFVNCGPGNSCAAIGLAPYPNAPAAGSLWNIPAGVVTTIGVCNTGVSNTQYDSSSYASNTGGGTVTVGTDAWCSTASILQGGG